ncbi:hypothetical protein [Arundinibacter roseus]|uniref:Glycosyltransferase RgtA/B/C/D-like domain-containing protein n=1 Tax=Arundinibacter roseus TaxID=2070510 RepID=A0A4R4KH81_9BACT|nr:hypothetical protein [Arundinibacter roseus]TDB65991.1 hypothetical protein EZE20_09520 [Arundinibacter roseus]
MITFDASPMVYWALAYGLALIVLWLSQHKRISTPVYLTVSILLFVAMRLPAVVLNRELNADESQMLSHALTLFQDPVYWRSVDGTTIGPLDNYLLVLPRLLGFQLDYTSARVMSVLCNIGSLLFFFVAMQRWFGSQTARTALLLPLFFLAFTQETDFVHYSSEQLPVFLLSICLALLAYLPDGFQANRLSVTAYVFGFVAGMIPFAKLQAVPQAVILVLGAGYEIWRMHRHSNQIKPFFLLALGGISFPALALIWVLWQGVFQDFINFYILGNAVYAGGSSWSQIPTQFGKLVLLSPDFTALLVILAAFQLASFFTQRKKDATATASDKALHLPLIIATYSFAALYAATKSGNLFVHYLAFCVYPLALFGAAAAQRFAFRPLFAILAPLLMLGWFGLDDGISFIKKRELNSLVSVEARHLLQSPVVMAMHPFQKSGDQMVVWGWQCRYYVEAQLAQGTAENHSERCIFEHPLRDVYRERFIRDMQRNQPAFFLDAVGKNSLWLQNKDTQGHEIFPELAAYISTHYQLVEDIDDTRLYIRRDRL